MLVHDNERRWRVSRARVAKVTAAAAIHSGSRWRPGAVGVGGHASQANPADGQFDEERQLQPPRRRQESLIWDKRVPMIASK